jgi:hypothetical protein
MSCLNLTAHSPPTSALDPNPTHIFLLPGVRPSTLSVVLVSTLLPSLSRKATHHPVYRLPISRTSWLSRTVFFQVIPSSHPPILMPYLPAWTGHTKGLYWHLVYTPEILGHATMSLSSPKSLDRTATLQRFAHGR